MALRFDRPSKSGHPAPGPPSSAGGLSAKEVGRALRRARSSHGLSLRDVSVRTGLPVEALRAAEVGALDEHDQLGTLRTVRHYADYLGLPGDRYALAILECWPFRSGSRTGQVPRGDDVTAVVAAAGPGGDVTATLLGPAADTASTASAPVTALPDAPVLPGAARVSTPTGQLLATATQPVWGGGLDDTGISPAVPLPRAVPARHLARRRRTSLLMRAALAFLVVLVVVGVGLLVVSRVHPSWLHAVGTSDASRTSGPGVRSAAAGAAKPAVKAPSGSATSIVPSTGSTRGATFRVSTSSYELTVGASGGPCWVQVTSPGQSAPAFSGVLEPGRTEVLHGTGTLTVELGAASGRLSVTSSKGQLHTFAPPAAPYRATFTTGG